MDQRQKNVLEFHELFQVNSPDKPTMPDVDVRKFRCKMILEEALEFVAACGLELRYESSREPLDMTTIDICQKLDESVAHEKFIEPNLVEMADALFDLDYVSDGAKLACGIDGEPLAAEGHRSNMSKAWSYGEVAQHDQSKQRLMFECIEVGAERKWIAKREDRKVVKSPSYLPADFATELKKQGWEE